LGFGILITIIPAAQTKVEKLAANVSEEFFAAGAI
jgi:hypothetical protein